jgi:phosphoribosylformylglycinamidine synthase
VINKVRRIFVEKKKGFDVEAQGLYADLRENLGIRGLAAVRIVNRYDIAGLEDEEYLQSRITIFSEPTADYVYDEELNGSENEKMFAIEFLPGQYDQRADSAAQCVQILTQKERPAVRTAKVILVAGQISEEDFTKIKEYNINTVESREASLDKPQSLEMEADVPADVAIMKGFITKSPEELRYFIDHIGLAMNHEDLVFCQAYFRDEVKRNPTITEIKVIDTYWSDHCRHTTFLTQIEDVQIQPGKYTRPVQAAYREYLASRDYVYGQEERDISLMDIAVMGMKELRKRGRLPDLDESDEINACSIVVNVDRDGKSEEWLVMFKNETHNHPTEIEPCGGAATCLGGAIRDPLSGRTYVYQAMRVTGSADPRVKIEDTLPGKLPQRTITTGAADGYSSYGNQIGLATGQVVEVYHENFVAKRMEIGAVIAAAPKKNVLRANPCEGDIIILVGGRTGRDGCGGATGSSKEHTEESLYMCGAEVQKGNPPTERKIQRLFRHPKVSTMIKKCNDFGAGGVSVAIGELTDGLEINLDAIPKKYEGLDGTELAISESQERMAVVVAADNAETFIACAAAENLEATVVATVTAERRLKMLWRGKPIVDISRDFLNTNGVKQRVGASVMAPDEGNNYFSALPGRVEKVLPDLYQAWMANLTELNVCSQKGLVERFDSTIGTGTVLMPFGGKYQATPTEGMVAKIPVLEGDTTTGTVMTYGYDPHLAMWSPFHGAAYAVIESIAKVVALGGDYRNIRLSLQEYFEKLGTDAEKWGKPFSALLGAYCVQKKLNIPAIGGKDSMSGTFKDLHVPPTLVSFAVDVVDVRNVVSQEFKKPGSTVVLVPLARDEHELPDFDVLDSSYCKIYELMQSGRVLASQTVKTGGLAAAITKMSFGNRIGMVFHRELTAQELFAPNYGAIVLELDETVHASTVFGDVAHIVLGQTQAEPAIVVNGVKIDIDAAFTEWEKPLEKIFPTQTEIVSDQPRYIPYHGGNVLKAAVKIAQPRIFIPVFPGTNCEYDSARAFTKAGGIVDTMVVRNLTSSDVEQSIEEMAKRIKEVQIVMLPGGFSAGDEPDGSGKFIATMFRNPKVKDAVIQLLKQRDGLMLGICNGFQALIKLGLVPYGEIIDLTEACPTLTYNKIGRHVSSMMQTKVVSTLSPWFNNVKVADIHTVAISHGEGRFVANRQEIDRLLKNGQVASQYVDLAGHPSNNICYNANGSMEAIEGITSPDGRVLGKMAHSERVGTHVAINVPGNKDQRIFEAGVNYFK